jgi:hypothetical protein
MLFSLTTLHLEVDIFAGFLLLPLSWDKDTMGRPVPGLSRPVENPSLNCGDTRVLKFFLIIL